MRQTGWRGPRLGAGVTCACFSLARAFRPSGAGAVLGPRALRTHGQGVPVAFFASSPPSFVAFYHSHLASLALCVSEAQPFLECHAASLTTEGRASRISMKIREHLGRVKMFVCVCFSLALDLSILFQGGDVRRSVCASGSVSARVGARVCTSSVPFSAFPVLANAGGRVFLRSVTVHGERAHCMPYLCGQDVMCVQGLGRRDTQQWTRAWDTAKGADSAQGGAWEVADQKEHFPRRQAVWCCDD